MGHYVAVRGWIEIEAERLPYVKQLLQRFPSTSGEGVLTPEQVRLYAQGWVLAEDSPNWTKYCFYGADIRREGLTWFLAQVRLMAQATHDVDASQGDVDRRYTGVFFIDDDAGEMSIAWYVKEGEVIEHDQSPKAIELLGGGH